jgi:hypothetical protein
MRKPTWERLLLCGGLLLVVSSARADDEVLHRLAKFGKLSGGEANRIVQAVSGRMKRAADMTSDSDPLRMAVSNALYNTPVSKDAMAAAKIRLRLYAGLNEWALENLFAARAGSMATCTTQFGLGKHDCQALLAAGGKVSVAEAGKLGAGAPVLPAQGFGQAAPQPSGFGQPAQAQGSRFGSYNSGYVAQAPRYGAQPAFGAQPAQPAYAAPVRQQPVPVMQPAARPMAAAPVMAAPPPPSAQTVAARKAEYERQRQEYLARKQQEMAARKAKVVSTAGGTERVARGPGSEDEAAVMGVAPTAQAKAAASAAPAKAGKAEPAAAAGEDSPVAAAEEPAPAPKAALDNGFLDGLLGDPLGKK